MGSLRAETCSANYKIKNFPRRKCTFGWEIFTFNKDNIRKGTGVPGVYLS
jgi:hypothetical protein